MIDLSPPVYTIYGVRLSWFTRKLEAAFELRGIPFRSAVRTLSIQNELELLSGTHQIPVLVAPDGEVRIDSTSIMQWLDRTHPEHPLYPEGPLGALVDVLEEVADEWLPRTAMNFRWQYDECSSWAARQLALESAPGVAPAVQELIEATVADWGQRSCRALGVTSEGQRAAALDEMDRLLEALDSQLGRTAYTLGDRPTAVDAALLGALRAHILADPVPRKRYRGLRNVCSWSDKKHRPQEGSLAPFPEATPFARTLMDIARGPYARYVAGNREALARNEKAFVIENLGEEVSYKSLRALEDSRRHLGQRVVRASKETRGNEVTKWLQDWELTELFTPGD